MKMFDNHMAVHLQFQELGPQLGLSVILCLSFVVWHVRGMIYIDITADLGERTTMILDFIVDKTHRKSTE